MPTRRPKPLQRGELVRRGIDNPVTAPHGGVGCGRLILSTAADARIDVAGCVEFAAADAGATAGRLVAGAPSDAGGRGARSVVVTAADAGGEGGCRVYGAPAYAR